MWKKTSVVGRSGECILAKKTGQNKKKTETLRLDALRPTPTLPIALIIILAGALGTACAARVGGVGEDLGIQPLPAVCTPLNPKVRGPRSDVRGYIGNFSAFRRRMAGERADGRIVGFIPFVARRISLAVVDVVFIFRVV